MESKTSLCFWAQADESGSPDFFFLKSVIQKVKQQFWHSLLSSRKNGGKRNCFYRLFEKEVVLFLVFISFQDACLPLCTWVRNQSLMWQETVLCEHKAFRKLLSLNKKNHLKCKRVWKNMNQTFWLHDVPWLFSSYNGFIIFIVPSLL